MKETLRYHPFDHKSLISIQKLEKLQLSVSKFGKIMKPEMFRVLIWYCCHNDWWLPVLLLSHFNCYLEFGWGIGETLSSWKCFAYLSSVNRNLVTHNLHCPLEFQFVWVLGHSVSCLNCICFFSPLFTEFTCFSSTKIPRTIWRLSELIFSCQLLSDHILHQYSIG